MIKNLYALCILPLNFYNYILNLVYLNVTNTEYKDFPKINGRIIRRGRGKLRLGGGLKLNSDGFTNPIGIANKCMFYSSYKAEIHIGDNVGISTSLLYATLKITLEDDVVIGGGCQIIDSDFHSISYADRILKADCNIQSSPILIKKGAFIGTRSIILKGVIVGERSVIAAGSVVSKSIPSDEIWGGNPAKFIKKINLI